MLLLFMFLLKFSSQICILIHSVYEQIPVIHPMNLTLFSDTNKQIHKEVTKQKESTEGKKYEAH